MKAKQLWIARDMNGDLYLYEDEPKLDNTEIYSAQKKWIKEYWFYGHMFAKLNSNLFKEVTFENSPQKVSLTLDYL